MSFAPAAPSSRFRMEDALQATFDAVFANSAVFTALALALTAAPNLVAQLVFRPTPGPATGASGLFVAGLFLKPVVSLAGAALLQGAVAKGVFDHLNRAKPHFAPCLRAGLTTAPALVAIGLLFGLAAVFGLVFLVGPGLFVIALWAPAGAVAVAERRGVFGAFGRAAELTRGHRWAVLIVMVVTFVLGAILSGLGAALAALVVAGAGSPLVLAGAVAGGALTPAGAVVLAVNAVVGSLAMVLTSAAPAALYVELRRSREGAGPSELAALFD